MEVARYRLFEGGDDGPLADPLRCRSSAVEEVAEALYDNPLAEEVGELCNVLTVGNRLVKWFGEGGGDEDGKVGVVSPFG